MSRAVLFQVLQAIAQRNIIPFEKRVNLHARVNQSSWSVTSVTEKARHISRMTRSVDASADDPSKVVVADTVAAVPGVAGVRVWQITS